MGHYLRCPLCQRLVPVLEELASTYGEHMTFATVDLDDNAATGRATASRRGQRWSSS
ncbi:MAG: thioredoxin domain-containing protein [Geodermatophilaceae bacterium]